MELTTVWFVLIAVLWIGYFVLEGFDFGVGILLPVLGRNEPERRAMIHTIGPVWDGNEVWLLVAGGATFAAFPEWYATLFSGFYLALFADPGGADRARRRLRVPRQARRAWPGGRRWDRAIASARFVPALLWGVAFANIVRGVPIDADKEFTGDLLHPAQPVRPARRADDAAAVRHPRRALPGPQDRGRHPRAGATGSPAGSAWPRRWSRSPSWAGR